MTATTVTHTRTLSTLDHREPRAATQERPITPARTVLAGTLYQFHSLRMLDADDQPVGLVDWIWSDDPGGQGEFIGVQLRWLRGTARAIPADGVQIDRQSGTIRVAYPKEQIRRAPRFAIDRALTAEQKGSIRSHYRPLPTVGLTPAVAESLAA